MSGKPQHPQILLKLKTQFGLPADKQAIVFAPPRLDLYRGDPIKAVQLLSKFCKENSYGFLVKLHPFQGDVDRIKSVLPGVPVFNDNDASPFLFCAQAVVTQTSTVSLEALAMGKKVIELDVDYMGIEQPLWKTGNATLVDGEDLSEIKNVMENKREITDEMKDRLYLADGQSAARIVSKIESTQWVK
jgi:CDP-glycerol glycerophosphotransferase (TagB/SpsB family)